MMAGAERSPRPICCPCLREDCCLLLCRRTDKQRAFMREQGDGIVLGQGVSGFEKQHHLLRCPRAAASPSHVDHCCLIDPTRVTFSFGEYDVGHPAEHGISNRDALRILTSKPRSFKRRSQRRKGTSGSAGVPLSSSLQPRWQATLGYRPPVATKLS